ncbi:TrmH family RNA methyltransferase, partial [Escherichia coli]
SAVTAVSQCRGERKMPDLSLIHISEPTRLDVIAYAVFCLKRAKMVLVLGQEYEGLPDAARDPNDLRVKIDGTGNVAGLNISVATGVLLGEWWRQNKA